jgi:hypothetical protein
MKQNQAVWFSNVKGEWKSTLAKKGEPKIMKSRSETKSSGGIICPTDDFLK